MKTSNIVFQMEYKKFKNKKHGISQWVKYVSNKSKADSSSIDEYNLLKDYALFSDKDMYLNEDLETFLWTSDGDILKEDIVSSLDNNKGFFWRGFVSFPPEFAYNHGLVTKVDYYSLSNNFITALALDMGLDLNNISWYCALHRNTRNPHIHFCIFEKVPTKTSPLYSKSCISKCKSNIANYLVDYEQFYKLRDQTFKNITGNISLNNLNMIKGQRLFSDKYRHELNKMLLTLYSKLPKKGRLQYNSKNMIPFKKDLDSIIEYILMHDSIKYEYAKYLKLLDEHQKELENLYGYSKDNQERKYYNDQLNRLYSKIGNEILDNYKKYEQMEVLEKEREFLRKHIYELRFRSRTDYRTDKSKTNIAKDLYRICLFANLNDRQIKKVFTRWNRNSHYHYDIDLLIASLSISDSDMSIQELYSSLKKLGYSYERYNKVKTENFYRELNYKRFINKAMNHLIYELNQEEKQIISNIQYELEEYK
ncbi:hypothetical protein EGW03_02735 [bacterium]|nr:hypothetical protein [bacterium]